MLPKSHILLGVIFSLFTFILFPSIGLLGFLTIFLSSFLIDVDHYLVYVLNKKEISMKKAYSWHLKEGEKEIAMLKKGIKKKGHFHFLHTLEFQILLLILSFFYNIFLFIFIGFLFHSLVDFIDLCKRNLLYRREYFFTSWLLKKLYS